MSRNTRKLRHKVRNCQNLPYESPNFTIYFFHSNFTYNLGHFSTSLRPHYQNSFFSKYFFLFSALNSKMSRNLCIWLHKLCNAKTGVGPTFTWSNEPWYNWALWIRVMCTVHVYYVYHVYRAIVHHFEQINTGH